MSKTIIAPAGYTLGDGSSAGQVASARWATWRWFLGIGALAVTVLTVLALLQAPSNNQPLSTHNHQPSGARAVAEVLRDQGVTVEEVNTLQEANIALADGGTLAIASYGFLSEEQIDSIQEHAGETVWIAPGSYELDELRPEFSPQRASESETLTAGCAVPAAERAETLTGVPERIAVDGAVPGLAVCFSADGGASGAYLAMERADAETVHLFADPAIVNNAGLDTDGAAALAFNVLGSQEKLVWYVGGPYDGTLLGGEQPGGDYFTPMAPAWLGPAVVALGLTGLMAALWRGRRMGRLVTEPLPVVVRASEATRGRARLYRRGGARGHASAALRAGAASRMARRLGLPRSAGREAVVNAIAGTTGRDTAQISELLYGPAPRSDDQMLDLVAQLDALESEVSTS